MIDATLLLTSATGTRRARLATYLDPAADERATIESLAWIKQLRSARIDGEPLRRRFNCRGDSLWWFAELYLHKQQVVSNLFRATTALLALIDREQPRQIELVDRPGARDLRLVAAQIAKAHGIGFSGPTPVAASATWRLAAMEARASTLNAAAMASRLRARPVAAPASPPAAVAFVHRAFWRASGDEAYIGPVLHALERRLGEGALAYVTVGPATNFRARRWWHPLAASDTGGHARPIEAFAPLGRLDASRAIWRDRHRNRRLLWTSDDIRSMATIHGCDCWPILREELAGIALLQWPWSARAMDEAAAALDVLQPRVAVTYAEAGGWGRALVLESRRRGIPLAGLQHGFIYRHWLNYRHEPDEMLPDAGRPADRGFPAPTRTLLFDRYAADHLTTAGAFPADALAVTGSPRLDALVDDMARLTPDAIARARATAGPGAQRIVLVTTKYKEARSVLGTLIDAAATLPGVHVAIKTHPAETPDAYRQAAADRPHVTVLDAATPLAPLLRACDVVATVNSTVALDAAVLDVPALVIGLPNNLTPFVDAGVMAGVPATDTTIDATARALQQILYDEEFRHRLRVARRAFLDRYGIGADGRAAARAADAVLALAERR